MKECACLWTYFSKMVGEDTKAFWSRHRELLTRCVKATGPIEVGSKKLYEYRITLSSSLSNSNVISIFMFDIHTDKTGLLCYAICKGWFPIHPCQQKPGSLSYSGKKYDRSENPYEAHVVPIHNAALPPSE